MPFSSKKIAQASCSGLKFCQISFLRHQHIHHLKYNHVIMLLLLAEPLCDDDTLGFCWVKAKHMSYSKQCNISICLIYEKRLDLSHSTELSSPDC
jgi:N6-adenosine-specific RNA methylase IME4